MSVQTFHELYVVSDLHLGGKPGFQIFRQGDTLANFIKVCAQPSDRKIGVVLNGDIVDFLAEAPAAYLDPKHAIDKLERIFYEDSAFSGVWSALQEFVAQPNRQLILVLGNHDVELALPHVIEWILEKLSGGDSAARGRVTTCFDGAGFPCKVGNKSVFCIHGNDVDIWNMVNHKQLLDDVMNAVKRKYPIVDLLKPEVEAVVPILMTLDPGSLTEISKILVVAANLSMDILRTSFEGMPPEEEMVEGPAFEKKVMADFFNKYFEYDEAKSMNTKEEELEALGAFAFIPAFFSNKEKKVEKLRKALKENLESDQSFVITEKDKMFKEMKKKIGSKINYLITGHSHKERAIARKAPDCYYFNSGTWIRLIRLTEDVLGNSEEFARVYAAFESGSMEQLDAINDLGPSHDQPLVMLKPTVVSIVEKDGETYGELRHANPDGSLKPVENTRLPGK
jgi:UDP-2,3-diacylglucosamine pyrophosphatase LpxH